MLAALDPHPAIRTEVRADGGRVGVLPSVRGNAPGTGPPPH
ncbi:hypothetical protein ACFY3N_19260 [Streptomyces sp. NPDC000348]